MQNLKVCGYSVWADSRALSNSTTQLGLEIVLAYAQVHCNRPQLSCRRTIVVVQHAAQPLAPPDPSVRAELPHTAPV